MGAPGLPAEFRVEHGAFIAVRQHLTVASTRRWLRQILRDGRAPALDRLPDAEMRAIRERVDRRGAG
jgi:hypothetical protein